MELVCYSVCVQRWSPLKQYVIETWLNVSFLIITQPQRLSPIAIQWKRAERKKVTPTD